MFRLYRLESLTDPDARWLDYECGESFDNAEWRPCVEHFLSEVVAASRPLRALEAAAHFKRQARGVVAGQFEIGVSQSSEIMPVAGVTFVRGLPAPFDLRTAHAIAALGGSEHGRRLMRYFDSVAAHAQFANSGFSDQRVIVTCRTVISHFDSRN